MTQEKFQNDTQTLHRFIQLHCSKEHKDVSKREGVLDVHFRETPLEKLSYELCEECEVLLHYAYNKLQNCPHETKPSCRKCPQPCYDKPMWKKMAHIMMYSGMRLGLTKMRKLFFK